MLWHKNQGAGGVGGGGGAGIEYVGQNGVTYSTVPDSPFTIPLPSGLQEDDLVFVFVAHDGSSNISNPDTWTASGWTEAVLTQPTDYSYPGNVAVYVKVMGSTPDTEISIASSPPPTGGRGQPAGISMAFRGATYTGSGVAYGSSGMPDCPQVDVSEGDVLIAFGYLDDDFVTSSAPSGYENYRGQQGGDSRGTLFASTKTIPSLSVEDPPAYSGTGNDYWVGITVKMSPA